jgi:ribosomal protein L2
MYRMTADGLSELAMSFSGDEARIVRMRSSAHREIAEHGRADIGESAFVNAQCNRLPMLGSILSRALSRTHVAGRSPCTA